jgi:hypothetical protein
VALFDSYVMVDWSAEARPKRGKDSIWLAHLRRAGGAWVAAAPVNPATRAEAAAAIQDLLEAERAAGRRVLIGFDFPLGYPQGFAARLGLAGAPWRAVWQEFARLLVDDAANGNNRFAVAEALNRRISGGAFPFWGCPRGSGFATLEPIHHRRHDSEGLAERRLVDLRARSSQPVWKLVGIGAAGSQALTGIPVLERLKARFGEALAVWPYETGLAAGEAPIVVAEIYPSLFPPVLEPDEVKDAAQVRTTARHFGELDERAELEKLFAGDPLLTEAERAAVVAEEGWVLGVTTMRSGPSKLGRVPSPAAAADLITKRTKNTKDTKGSQTRRSRSEASGLRETSPMTRRPLGVLGALGDSLRLCRATGHATKLERSHLGPEGS